MNNVFLKAVHSSIVGAFGAFIGFFYGGMTNSLKCALIFIIVDYVTGVLAAAVSNNPEDRVSSKKSCKGIVKKLMMLIIISLCHFIDLYVIGKGDSFLTGACFLFIGNEGISILENASRLGVPIPKKLLSILSQLKKDSGSATTKDIEDAISNISKDVVNDKDSKSTDIDVQTSGDTPSTAEVDSETKE